MNNTDKILKLAFEFEKLVFAAERIDTTDSRYEQFMQTMENFGKISDIFQSRFKEKLSGKFLNKKIVPGKYKFIISSSDISDLYKIEVPDIIVEIRSEKTLDENAYNIIGNRSGNQISIIFNISSELILSQDNIHFFSERANKVFRHELQHFEQNISNKFQNRFHISDVKDIDDPNTLLAYYISEHEIDAHVASSVEEAIKKSFLKLKEDKNHDFDVIDIKEIFDPKIEMIKQKLKGRLDPEKIDILVDTIYKKWFDWYIKNYPVKSI